MFSAPSRPFQDVLPIDGDAHCESVEEPAELVEGQRDQADRRRSPVTFGGGGDCQERHRQHHQHGPAMPGRPGPDLMLIQTGLPLRRLERLFDLPAPPGPRSVAAAKPPRASNSGSTPTLQWYRCGAATSTCIPAAHRRFRAAPRNTAGVPSCPRRRCGSARPPPAGRATLSTRPGPAGLGTR